MTATGPDTLQPGALPLFIEVPHQLRATSLELFSNDEAFHAYTATVENIIDASGLRRRQLKNVSTQTDIVDIVARGAFRGHEIIPPEQCMPGVQFPAALSNEGHLAYRLALLGVYLRNPRTAEAIVASRMIGLFGSNSATLMTVVQEGLGPSLMAEPVVGYVQEIIQADIDDEEPGETLHFVPFHHSYARVVGAYSVDDPKGDEAQVSEVIGEVTGQLRKIAKRPWPEYEIEEAVEERELQKARLGRMLIELQGLRTFRGGRAAGSEGRMQQHLLELNFPVIYGVGSEALDPDACEPAPSGSTGAFAYKETIPPGQVTPIFVPRMYIDVVTPLIEIHRLPARVFAIEDVPAFDSLVGVSS